MDKLDEVLQTATVKVKGDIDPQSEMIEDQKALPNELLLAFFQLRSADLNKEDLEKMKDIEEYIDSALPEGDRMDKIQLLRDIKFKLGAPEIGFRKFDQVHQYIRLKMAAQKYTEEAQAMEE